MKKLLLMLMAIAVMTGLQAQKDSSVAKKGGRKWKSTEERATAQSDSIQKITGCSDEQKAKIYTLVLNRDQKIKEIRQANKGNKEEAEKQIQPVRKQFRQDLKAVLTPEQFAKLKAEKEEKRKERKAEKKASGK